MIRKILFIAAGAFCILAQGAPLTRVVPINTAEAVFAPFWDGSLEERHQWKVTAGRLRQSWHTCTIDWDRKEVKRDAPAFEMIRREKFSCAGYDLMIFSTMIPLDAKLEIILETDQGVIRQAWIGVKSHKEEYPIPLKGAQEIRKITYRIFDTGKNKTASGAIYWGGLQNTRTIKLVEQQYRQLAAQPLTRFLAPEGTVPEFKGRVNMLMPAAELKLLQNEYAKVKKLTGKAPFEIPDHDWCAPEKNLRSVLPFANTLLFGRVRDQEQKLLDGDLWIRYALIAEDAELMDKIVRTAIVIALTPNWDSTFLSDFADSGWDQRVFSHNKAAIMVALVLDYAYDMLSASGRDLLAKRLAVEALGQINYNVWKYRYLFGNNQLTVFSRGRIAAYLALEGHQAGNALRIKPYTELALKELLESIGMLVHEDGSFMEGPAYFLYTMNYFHPAVAIYANARKIPLHQVLPPGLKSLGNFGDVFSSTDRRGGLIPVSSGQGPGRDVFPDTALFLAKAAPESQWVNIYLNSVAREKDGDMAFVQKAKNLVLKPVKTKPVSELKTMGVMASTRYFKGEPVKMLLVGTKADTRSHRHNDRGSFVLEFAGDTYAADPGGQAYSDSDGAMVKRSDYHNMLVPADLPDNEPMAVAKADVYPQGQGDETSFSAVILPAPSSYNYFSRWKRSIHSPVPERFTIRDEYELTGRYKAVRFLWITELPWKKVRDGVIRLDGQKSYVLIHYPAELKFSADDLLVRRKERFHRLNFEKAGTKGSLEIHVELYRK